MQYDPVMREKIKNEAVGKVVASLVWVVDSGGYWVMTFTDGSEISFRSMAEIVN